MDRDSVEKFFKTLLKGYENEYSITKYEDSIFIIYKNYNNLLTRNTPLYFHKIPHTVMYYSINRECIKSFIFSVNDAEVDATLVEDENLDYNKHIQYLQQFNTSVIKILNIIKVKEKQLLIDKISSI